MLRPILVTAILLALINSVRADRMLYTIELLDAATIVAVWGPDNITESQKELRLGRPNLVLKGKAATIANSDAYSLRLKTTLQDIHDKEISSILFLRKALGKLDLVSDSGAIPSSQRVLKAIRAVRDQALLQHHIGNGSDYCVMHSVPLDQAKAYLPHLRETGLLLPASKP